MGVRDIAEGLTLGEGKYKRGASRMTITYDCFDGPPTEPPCTSAPPGPHPTLNDRPSARPASKNSPSFPWAIEEVTATLAYFREGLNTSWPMVSSNEARCELLER